MQQSPSEAAPSDPGATQPKAQPRAQPLIAYCLERGTLRFALKTSLLVGTILAAINHGPAMVTGRFTVGELLPLGLTYCVPFLVSMFSQAQGKRQRDLAKFQ